MGSSGAKENHQKHVYSVMENPGVHSALLLQVLLRASEAAGSEHANPDPGKGAFSSPPPSATETWPCHLKNFEAVQN